MTSVQQIAVLNGLSLKEGMQRIGFTILFLLATYEIYAQKQANHWVFGDSAWLEFTDTGIIQRKANISTREASSSINKKGTDSLLFYATPNSIYNRDGNAVVQGLKGHHSATQGALFLAHPDCDSVINLFTSDEINSKLSTGLYHHAFNVNGSVLLKNDTMLIGKTEQLSAVNHQNNRHIWIVAHKSISDSFYLFLLRQDGVLDCPIIYASGNPYSAFWADGSILKFAPNGRYLAGALPYGDKLELYMFNSETGRLDSQIVINNQYAVWGTEFSSNSKILYVSTGGIPSLVQFDLTNFKAASLINSRTVLSSQKRDIGHIQLAINGKIYLAYLDSTHLGVINKPDIMGSGCMLDEQGLNLQFGICKRGLPTFNQSHFYFPSVDFSYRENCHNLNYEFEAEDTFNATSYIWYYTNPDSSVTESKSGKSLSYHFVDTGTWTVQLIASNGTQTETVTKSISIRPAWKPDFLGNDTFYCADNPGPFMLKAPLDMHCIHWMGSPAFGQVDTFVADTAGTYFVKVTNKSFCTTYDTITIQEIPNPAVPSVIRIGDTLYCQTDSGNYQWFRDNQSLPGETSQSLTLRKNGNYTVTVFNDYGCAATSVPILVDDVSVRNMERFGVRVYPNPASDIITVDWSESHLVLQSARMMDVRGQTLLNQALHLKVSRDQLEVSQVAAGTYILELRFNDVVLREMVVINQP